MKLINFSCICYALCKQTNMVASAVYSVYTLCMVSEKKIVQNFRKILKYLVVARVHYPGVGKIMKIKNFETFSNPPPPCDVSPRV